MSQKFSLDASIFYQPEKEFEENVSSGPNPTVVSPSDSNVSAAVNVISSNNIPGSSKDSSLDVTSHNVDWKKCFEQRDIELPCPDAKLEVDLTTIQSFSELTVQNVTSLCPKLRAAEFSTTKIDRDRKKKQAELVAANKQNREAKFLNSNILFYNTHRHGPQSFLGKAVKSHKKFCVITRSFKGIRGICVGFLLAFDRYSNMIIIDVCEIWRQPLLGEAFHKEESLTVCFLKTLFQNVQTSDEKDKKALPNRLQYRNVGQLFLRGSNVVLSCWL